MPLTGAAAARLYDDHVDAVHALVIRRVGSPAGPSVVGEVFEHAVRSWDRFDQERGSERMFLFGAAIVVLRRHGAAEREHLRSLSVRDRIANSVWMADPLVGRVAPPAAPVEHDAHDDQIETSEAPVGSILMTAVADLAPDDRDIVLLSLWESCSQPAIAQAIDLSVGTVRSALGRIRRDLKAATTAGGRPAVNVFDEIQASRPEGAPMAIAERRRIRESLFGIGHDDRTRTIGGRSPNGAVVSTAPYGTRRPIQKRPRASGSLAKLGAGLLVLTVLGAAVWSYASRGETIETAATTTAAPQTTSTTSTSSPAPTTLPPVVRTGVSTDMPLALPPDLLTADEAIVAPAADGSTSAVFAAPDGSEVWMAEFDGEPSDLSNLDFRQIGSIGVGVDRDRKPDDRASYRLLVPCGFVIVNDGPDEPLDRQAIIDLFSTMSIDGDATIDIALPVGWSVVSIGAFGTSYTAQFQVPAIGGGDAAPLRLSQVPGGALAQLLFGGRQIVPVEFLGAPAFLETGSADPAVVSVFWRDGPTVFHASSSALTLNDIEQFVDTLEPAVVDEWNQRFPTADPTAEPSDTAAAPACVPQPDFGPTLQP